MHGPYIRKNILDNVWLIKHSANMLMVLEA